MLTRYLSRITTAFRYLVVLSSLMLVGSARAAENTAGAKAEGDRVVAIDVLLLPDATMNAKAEAANARLREDYPKGYTLGQEQVSHITLVHCYVREKDLPAVEAAVSKVAAAAKPRKWKLTATGYTSAAWNGVAITTIGIERTKELDKFDEDIINAVESFTLKTGTTAAFNTNRELPEIENQIVTYVDKFIANSAGPKYNPHVTIGVAGEDFVKKLKAEPFEKFTFKPAGVAIYQLGSYGTAQKKLWEWKPKRREK